ncbi:DUF433 domain-containing protein [Salinirussus salinus]|jgi:uncharacterized protein (DUF433 family)|uniref:DUF433 domain-containing protein n=1 Tax=Salinirussus salinus TaxID=1198300 RepID=UPI001357C479|nr:DUF433 domain-containing protein [Salinirussus salinus]
MSSTVEIVRTPDVLHGKPRVEGTRIGVFTLGAAAEGGATVDALLDDYPALDRAEVEAALDYYDAHPELMDYIRMQKETRKQEFAEQSRAPTAES